MLRFDIDKLTYNDPEGRPSQSSAWGQTDVYTGNTLTGHDFPEGCTKRRSLRMLRTAIRRHDVVKNRVAGAGLLAGHPFAPDYFAGITGSTRAEGCCASCRMVLLALTKVCANLMSSPVLKLRSKRGKLLLEISTRSEWPRKNTLLVAQRSSVIS